MVQGATNRASCGACGRAASPESSPSHEPDVRRKPNSSSERVRGSKNNELRRSGRSWPRIPNWAPRGACGRASPELPPPREAGVRQEPKQWVS